MISAETDSLAKMGSFGASRRLLSEPVTTFCTLTDCPTCVLCAVAPEQVSTNTDNVDTSAPILRWLIMDRELFNMTDSTLALLADIILIVLATCHEGLSASYNGIVRPDLDRYRNG